MQTTDNTTWPKQAGQLRSFNVLHANTMDIQSEGKIINTEGEKGKNMVEGETMWRAAEGGNQTNVFPWEIYLPFCS